MKAVAAFEVIDRLLEQVREGEEDEDLFSFNDTKTGRSYLIYGTKVMEFYPNQNNKETKNTEETYPLIGLKVSQMIIKAMKKDEDLRTDEAQTFTPITISNEEEKICFVQALKKCKHSIFRNLVTDEFGCCSDFIRCSDAKSCLHIRDRFYNGCQYRRNLENGRIFYGKNRNID